MRKNRREVKLLTVRFIVIDRTPDKHRTRRDVRVTLSADLPVLGAGAGVGAGSRVGARGEGQAAAEREGRDVGMCLPLLLSLRSILLPISLEDAHNMPTQ